MTDGPVRDCWTLRGVGALNPLPGDEKEPFGRGTPAFMRAFHEAVDAPRKARTVGALQQIIAG